jgi:flagellar motor switch protein FliG
MTYDRTDRIRRAAILVASLDERLAEQMLDSLPPSEATKILAEAERLEEVDPDEVQDVLDEFRAAGRGGRAAETAVEFTYSAPQVPAKRDAAPPPQPEVNELSEQQEADAALMAELLTHEHPQTIAAALSRLGHEQGAAVFAKLPSQLQLDVLDRLTNLESADEDAVNELEVQLQRRIEEQRKRRERAVAAAEMARRMLERTPAAQRDALLARISPASGSATPLPPSPPAGAAGSTEPYAAAPSTLPMTSPAWTVEDEESSGRFEAWADEPAGFAPPKSSTPVSMRILLEDRSNELETLDERSLLEALRQAEERTVQCALAASSEKFLNRVAGKLPRRQANRLRQMVRSIGPTRLTELREAQHELLRLAHQSRTQAAA